MQAGLLERNAAIRLLNHTSSEDAEQVMVSFLEDQAGNSRNRGVRRMIKLAKKHKTAFLKAFARSLSVPQALKSLKGTPALETRVMVWFLDRDSQKEITSALLNEARPYETLHRGLIVRQLLSILEDPDATIKERLAALRELKEITEVAPTEDATENAGKFLDASFDWTPDEYL